MSAVQWFFPTEVNFFEYGGKDTIELLFPCDNPGKSNYGGDYDWPGGGRINPNMGGWGEHGAQRFIHRIHLRNNGAIYWSVDDTNRGHQGTAADVTYTYDAADLNSGSGTGHVLHTGFATATPSAGGWISVECRNRKKLKVNMSDAAPYAGDATEDYGWYPGNYAEVVSWVNDLYDDSEGDTPYLWRVAMGHDDETHMAPIQLKDAAGARYSIPSYDAGVSAANAQANSNPTNCLDLIDGSTDPMTDVNPRFDTKYDGVGQGSQDGIVYFQMPEWEGGMWAQQEWSGSDINDISKYVGGGSQGLHVRMGERAGDLVHEAFTSYGGPTGTSSGLTAPAAKRARFPESFNSYTDTDPSDGNYGQTRIKVASSGTAGTNGDDLNDDFEERGWVIMRYEHSGTAGLRTHSGFGRWNMDNTVDATELYSGKAWHSEQFAVQMNDFAYYGSVDGTLAAADCAVGILLDPDKPYLKYSVTGLPSGLSFDPDNRVIHGAVDAATATASTTVTYTATDFFNNSTSVTFTWTAYGSSTAEHEDVIAAAAAAAAAAATAAALAAAVAAAEAARDAACVVSTAAAVAAAEAVRDAACVVSTAAAVAAEETAEQAACVISTAAAVAAAEAARDAACVVSTASAVAAEEAAEQATCAAAAAALVASQADAARAAAALENVLAIKGSGIRRTRKLSEDLLDTDELTDSLRLLGESPDSLSTRRNA